MRYFERIACLLFWYLFMHILHCMILINTCSAIFMCEYNVHVSSFMNFNCPPDSVSRLTDYVAIELYDASSLTTIYKK
jgi:hypothetical protein